jgi:site-specific recombinase XerD
MTVHARKPEAARPLRDARAKATLTAVTATAPIRPTGKARALTRTLYGAHLTGHPSKAGDLFSRRTVEGYLEAVDALDEYLSAVGFGGDFPEVGAEALNGFLAAYRLSHTQGGTNTKMRRLRPFFGWVEATYGVVSPFRAGVVDYYAPAAPPPSALGDDVAGDMLATAKGDAFEDIRDTAIMRMLGTGVRRGELHRMHVEDIDFATGTVQLVALKGTKVHAPVMRVVGGVEDRAGRVVPLSSDALLALHKWLRVRAAHKLVRDGEAGPLWYATRGRGRMTGNGILRMVKRRAGEAGYDPATINVHAFRHTRAHTLLAKGMEEGDVMELLGWRDRGMLDRYGANLKTQRAHDAVRRAGLA